MARVSEHRCASIIGASELRELILIPLFVLVMIGVAAAGVVVVEDLRLPTGWGIVATMGNNVVVVAILVLVVRLPTLVRATDDGLRLSWGIARWSLAWSDVLGVEIHGPRILVLRRDRVGGEWLCHREPDTFFSDGDPLVVAIRSGVDRFQAQEEKRKRLVAVPTPDAPDTAPQRDAERGYREHIVDRSPRRKA